MTLIIAKSRLKQAMMKTQNGDSGDLVKLIEHVWTEYDRKKHHDWYWKPINECDHIIHKVHFAGHRKRLFMEFCDLFDQNVNALFYDNNNLINVVINSIIHQTVYKDSFESDFNKLGEKYRVPDYYTSKLMQYSKVAMGLGFALNDEQKKLKKSIRNYIPSRMPLIKVQKLSDLNSQYNVSDVMIKKYALSDYWPEMTYRMYLLGNNECYIRSYDFLYSSKRDRRIDFDVFVLVLWDWVDKMKKAKKVQFNTLKKYCVELINLVGTTNLDITPQFAQHFGLNYLNDSYSRIGTYARDAKTGVPPLYQLKFRSSWRYR